MSIDSEDTADVARIAVRPPQFRPDKPAMWFAQLEGQFVLANITRDETMYAYVKSQLDGKYIDEVEDIVTNPPEKDKYLTIKRELIKRLSISQEQKLRQLLEHEEIGDRKPSQFLRHLRSLAGPAVPDDFLRSLWLNRLPSYLRPILATQSSAPLEEAAQLADKVREICPMETAAVTPSTKEDDKFSLRLSRLEKDVAALKTACHCNKRSRSRSKSRTPNEGVCWFHWKYGAKATKCTKPCNYKPPAEN